MFLISFKAWYHEDFNTAVCAFYFCFTLPSYTQKHKQPHTFSMKRSYTLIHSISISPIDMLLCISRLRGNRRQLRGVGLPLVVPWQPSRQPALPRRMGWRRALHVGAMCSGTPRVWTRSSLKQVSLFVTPIRSQGSLYCLSLGCSCYVSS